MGYLTAVVKCPRRPGGGHRHGPSEGAQARPGARWTRGACGGVRRSTAVLRAGRGHVEGHPGRRQLSAIRRGVAGGEDGEGWSLLPRLAGAVPPRTYARLAGLGCPGRAGRRARTRWRLGGRCRACCARGRGFAEATSGGRGASPPCLTPRNPQTFRRKKSQRVGCGKIAGTQPLRAMGKTTLPERPYASRRDPEKSHGLQPTWPRSDLPRLPAHHDRATTEATEDLGYEPGV